MRVLWVSAMVVLVDQLSKLLVLDNLKGRAPVHLIGNWFKFTFTENPGMAFGINFGPQGLISVFSIVATLLIVYYLFSVRDGLKSYRISLALVLGGAIGNIVDRVFYGYFFNGTGILTGKVVDFIHLDIWNGALPDFLPFIGGKVITMFPIGNVADITILCGVAGIMLSQKKFHAGLVVSKEDDSDKTKVDADESKSNSSLPKSISTIDSVQGGETNKGEVSVDAG